MIIAISLTCIACVIGGISIYLTWDLLYKLNKRQRALPAPWEWETDITRIMTHVMPVLSGPYGLRRELGSWDMGDLHRSLLRYNSHVPLAQFEFDYEVQAHQYRFTSMLPQRKEPTHYTPYPVNAVVPDEGYVPEELEEDREKLVEPLT